MAELDQQSQQAQQAVSEVSSPPPVEVDADTSAAQEKIKQLQQQLDELQKKNKKPPPTGFFAGLAERINGVSKKAGGLKQALNGSPIAAALTPVGAAMAVVNTLVKAGALLWGSYMEKLQATAKSSRDVSDQLQKLSKINEERRQSDLSAMQQLQMYSTVEKLSNAQKADAEKLINRLNASYKGLGLALDETTGKVTGFDGAFTAMLEKQRQNKISETTAQLRQMEAEYNQLNDVMKNAGVHVGGFQIGGEQETLQAAERQKELIDQLYEKRKQLNDLKNADPEKDRQLKADAALEADREQLRIQQLRNQGQDEEAAKLEFMISLRSRNVDLTDEEKKKLWEINTQMEKEKKTAEEIAKKKAELAAKEDEIKRKAQERQEKYDEMISQSEFEIEMARLKSQGLDEEAAKLEFINELKRRGLEYTTEELEALYAQRQAAQEAAKYANSREYADKAVSDAEYELELQRLKNAGMDDEVDRLQLMREIKEKNLELTEEEIERILAARKELREMQQNKKNSSKASAGKETDSLAKIGLYNFGKSAVSSMDKERNTLLEQIRDAIKNQDTGESLS